MRPPFTEQTRENARKAAELIRKDGWIQDKRRTKDGLCAKEAMEAVCFVEHPELGRMTVGLAGLSEAFFLVSGAYPIPFNDTEGRTKEEVLAIFDVISS